MPFACFAVAGPESRGPYDAPGSIDACDLRADDSSDKERVVACPCCGGAVPEPPRAGDGSPTLAECDACDLYFHARPADRATHSRNFAGGPEDRPRPNVLQVVAIAGRSPRPTR